MYLHVIERLDATLRSNSCDGLRQEIVFGERKGKQCTRLSCLSMRAQQHDTVHVDERWERGAMRTPGASMDPSAKATDRETC